jgi:hypothetical protein
MAHTVPIVDRPERDAYAILGVPRSASRGAIAAAYRRLAKRHHPDAGAPPTAAMRDVNWAWGVLSDADRRRAYDAAHRSRTYGAHWTSTTGRPGVTDGPPEYRPGWAATGEPWSGGRTVSVERSTGLGCVPIGLLLTMLAVFVLVAALMSDVASSGGSPARSTPGITTAPVEP